MRYLRAFGLLMFVLVAPSVVTAQSNATCVAHGDNGTDFTWLLCPHGVKYERQYQYWGMWSTYYPVSSNTGECRWQTPRWQCGQLQYLCAASGCVKAKGM